jgi:D-threo-aldose 1-dehydrogenase
MQREGRVRFIGVSGRLAEVIAAVRTGEFDVVLSFNRFNLLDWSAQDELLPLAQAKNVGVTMGGVFYQGFLSLPLAVTLERAGKGLFWPWDMTAPQREKVLGRLERLSAFVGGDLAALRMLAVRFVLAEPRVGVTVIGMKTPAEVEENMRAARLGSLDAETVQQLKSLS